MDESWLEHCSELSKDDEEDWEALAELTLRGKANLGYELPWETESMFTGLDLLYCEQFAWAVENGHKALFQLVLDDLSRRRVDIMPYTTIIFGGTLLPQNTFVRLCFLGHDSLSRTLLGLGNCLIASIALISGLEFPAKRGNLELVDNILGAIGVYYVSILTQASWLEAAASGGHLDIVIRLLKKIANTEYQGIFKFLLPISGNLPMVPRLSEDSSQAVRAALETASIGGHSHIVEYLLELYMKSSNYSIRLPISRALRNAAKNGHLDTVNGILAIGLRFNVSTSNPIRPSDIEESLVAAAWEGHCDVVGRLLEAGANANFPELGYYRVNALKFAASRGHLETVECLLAAGSCAITSTRGIYALEAALLHGHLDVAKCLEKYGAHL